MATTIDFVLRRGLKADLPTTKVDGTAYFCMDTGEYFIDHPDPNNSNSIIRTQITGLLSATDKAKLDGIAPGATANTGTITKVQANGTDVASSGTANIPAASTSVYGVTKLSSSTSSTSTTLAATASAVKAAYDLANTASTTATSAQTTANAAMPKSGGTFTGAVYAGNSNQTYSTYLLRNTRLASSVTNPTVNGQICWTYG